MMVIRLILVFFIRILTSISFSFLGECGGKGIVDGSIFK